MRWLAATTVYSSGEASESEPWALRVLIVLLLAASTLSALYPQVVLQPLAQIMEAWATVQ